MGKSQGKNKKIGKKNLQEWKSQGKFAANINHYFSLRMKTPLLTPFFSFFVENSFMRMYLLNDGSRRPDFAARAAMRPLFLHHKSIDYTTPEPERRKKE